ncbi:hypothetical protein CALCODRAFT_140431 [Calocera cornea HHB12733]|uniref:Autophagy-related protein 27 n=1 Tax=Calocera cornea HHB12733 TaxID=1353952 RepID=A0A165K4R0_9BASI|nr:hypothetical protein CALCODRAFT_140431 [Calocera cornea HHB12733]
MQFSVVIKFGVLLLVAVHSVISSEIEILNKASDQCTIPGPVIDGTQMPDKIFTLHKVPERPLLRSNGNSGRLPPLPSDAIPNACPSSQSLPCFSGGDVVELEFSLS